MNSHEAQSVSGVLPLNVKHPRFEWQASELCPSPPSVSEHSELYLAGGKRTVASPHNYGPSSAAEPWNCTWTQCAALDGDLCVHTAPHVLNDSQGFLTQSTVLLQLTRRDVRFVIQMSGAAPRSSCPLSCWMEHIPACQQELKRQHVFPLPHTEAGTAVAAGSGGTANVRKINCRAHFSPAVVTALLQHHLQFTFILKDS